MLKEYTNTERKTVDPRSANMVLCPLVLPTGGRWMDGDFS